MKQNSHKISKRHTLGHF